MTAMINIDPDSELGQKLQRGFPECYLEIELPRRMPLSKFYFNDDPRKWFLYGVAGSLRVPVIEFHKATPYRVRYPMLPDNIDRDSKIGDVVEWEGHRYVVVDSGDTDLSKFAMVPLECIDPTIMPEWTKFLNLR